MSVMADYSEKQINSTTSRNHQTAGIIKRIRLENFMCHSNLEIELGEWVNFITGQNGSGKSAILTALCVAFGCRARGTQRATTLKDFIKTGCSSAIVYVEIKNAGEDAFKPDVYGNLIIVERRISESTSSIVLKDYQGKKVVSRKSELLELVDHFNIDVENPCVIMSQDKSREFLHSGSEKEKFKFYFKATLLQQVSDLLEGISNSLGQANTVLGELESEIRPLEKELNELQHKIKNIEQVEQIAQQVQQLRKKLAWSWVYHVDKQLEEQRMKIDKLKDRIPTCQARIDHQKSLLEGLKERATKKKAQITCMMEKTAEVRRLKDELQKKISLATKEKRELEEECSRRTGDIGNLVKRVQILEQQVQDIHEKHSQNAQANEFEREKTLRQLENEVDDLELDIRRLKEEENTLSESLQKLRNEVRNLVNEIDSYEKRHHEIEYSIRRLQGLQTNKVSAFGGDKVHNLLQKIERRCELFQIPPIGPIGAHLRLKDGDTWAYTVENAIGRMFNAFIVTSHKDLLLLKQCAREANYGNLQIFVYDFSRKRLVIPNHLLPNAYHPSTLSVLHSDNDTVINVLVDMGSAERQVLVKDYDSGKKVAFDPQILNVKEVHTMDGYKMFSRGSVQTILPPNKRQRTARLCSSYDDQIRVLEEEAYLIPEAVDKRQKLKREAERSIEEIERNLNHVKRLRRDAERKLSSKKLEVLDTQKFDDESTSASTVDELHQEISKLQEDIQEKDTLRERVVVRMSKAAASASDLKQSFKELCDSAQGDIDAFEKADRELMQIEEDIQSAETEKAHYEGVMNNKVMHDIEVAEGQYLDLQHHREENNKKASIICPESELESIGGWDGSSPDQLSAQLNRLSHRLQQESHRYSDSIDDLRMLYAEKERKISRKQQTYKAFQEKLDACQKALELRWGKFHRNASLLKRQLTWQFNGHLGKKGISGHIKINYEEKTLSVEVKMPQDASNSTVRDTRGLSGGERSFSTLCFALALHEMTEAPFRAMDEFDVFMDAVSRKISLDTLVDFAEAQGSQWIFITPHEISMVKQGDRIRKQQMAAPRS